MLSSHARNDLPLRFPKTVNAEMNGLLRGKSAGSFVQTLSGDRNGYKTQFVPPFDPQQHCRFRLCARFFDALADIRRRVYGIMSPICRPLSAARPVGLMSTITTPSSSAPATAFAGASVSPRTGVSLGITFFSALASEDVRGNFPTVTVIVFSCPLRKTPSFVAVPGAVAAVLLLRAYPSRPRCSPK